MPIDSTSPHIVFAGGGTGGHLFPGLAVAEQLALDQPSIRITFAGVGSRLRQHVATAGYEQLTLRARPFPRRPWDTWRFVADNLSGLRTARAFLRREAVTLVVGLGSYTSAAMVRSALAQKIPVVLIEANVLPGRATRWFADSASLLCTAFAQAREHLPQGVRLRTTGLPLRRQFVEQLGAERLRDPFDRTDRRQRLLVLGGSGGAAPLNESAPLAIHQCRARLRDWDVLHQAGPSAAATTAETYRALGLDAEVVPFIADLAPELAAADLVISRAGGGALAELALAAAPAIVVPFADATDDHQTANAELLAREGACRIIPERDPTGRRADRLASALFALITDPVSRVQLSEKIHRFARPHAAHDVAGYIAQLLTTYRCASAWPGGCRSADADSRLRACRDAGK